MHKIKGVLIINVLLDLIFINLIIAFLVYKFHYTTEFYNYFLLHYKSIFVMNFSWLFITYNLKLYHYPLELTIVEEISKIIKVIVLFSLILYSIAALRENPILDKWKISEIILYSFIYLIVFKIFFLFFIRKLRIDHVLPKDVLFIGNNKNYEKLKNMISKPNIYGLKHKKSIEIDSFEEEIENIKEHEYEFAFYFLNEKNSHIQENHIIEYCENHKVKIRFVPTLESFLSVKLESIYYDNVNILSFKNLPTENVFNRIIKRIFDIVFSLLVFGLFLWWLLPLFAILIKISSKGSIFFLQERIGLNNTPFKIMKFRTMYENAEIHGPKLSYDNDSRVTPIGKIYRKYRIDELPQFINVLKGDMSIVGPRPERKFWIDKIIEINPRYNRLHNIKPGITSLGQVHYGYASNVNEMIERLKYDLVYLNNYNLLMDFKIIIQTILVVIKGKGK